MKDSILYIALYIVFNILLLLAYSHVICLKLIVIEIIFGIIFIAFIILSNIIDRI